MQLPDNPNQSNENRLAISSDDTPGHITVILPESETPVVPPVVPLVSGSLKYDPSVLTSERDTEKGYLVEMESILGSKQTSKESVRVRLQSHRGKNKTDNIG